VCVCVCVWLVAFDSHVCFMICLSVFVMSLYVFVYAEPPGGARPATGQNELSSSCFFKGAPFDFDYKSSQIFKLKRI